MSVNTGYKPVRQFSLPAETVRHIWLPLKLSAISCFLLTLLYMINGLLQRLSSVILLPAEALRQEAEPRGQSRQEAIFRGQ